MSLRPLLILFVVSLWTCAPARAEWTPELQTLKGRLAFMQSLLQRHPNLVTQNLQFRRNLLEVLREIAVMEKALGDKAADPTIHYTTHLTHEYVTGGSWRYDEARVDGFKDEIKSALSSLPLNSSESIEKDLAKLKELSAGDEKVFKKSVQAWLRVLPYLYDDSGKSLHPALDAESREKISDKIEAARPNDLVNSFDDFLKNHLSKHVEEASKGKGLGATKGHLDAFMSSVVTKPDSTLNLATKPMANSDSTIQTRSLSLELLPPDVAVFRGCFGGDCSLQTIPLYPLLKGVSVYAIRKSKGFDAQPAGYLLVADAKVDGKTIPYIITVNGGGVSADDVKAAVRMVMHDKGSAEVIVPDFSKNLNVVNDTEKRNGLIYDAAHSVTVEMPDGWGVIDAKSGEYYQLDKLQHAYLVKPGDSGESHRISKQRVVSNYRPAEDPQKLSLINRAVLAAQAAADGKDTGGTESGQIRKLLDLTPEQVSAADPLARAHHQNPLTVDQFTRLQKEFAFTLTDVGKLDLLTAAYTLKSLHAGKPDLAPAEEWKTITQRVYDKIQVAANQAAGHEEAVVAAIQAQLALPAPYRPSDQEILREQFEKLDSKDPNTRAAGIGALGHFRKELTADSKKKLLTMFHDPDPLVRVAALQFFGKLENPPAAVVKAMERLLKDPASEVRSQAFAKLVKWFPKDPRMDKMGAPLLSDPAEEVRAAAVKFFVSRDRHSQEIVRLLSPNLALSDSDLRTKVANIVAGGQITDPRIQNSVELLLEDPNPAVRRTAIEVIPQFLVIPQELKEKAVLALHDEPTVREKAIRAVQQMNLMGRLDVQNSVLENLADSDEKVRRAASEAISGLRWLQSESQFRRAVALYRATENADIRDLIRTNALQTSWAEKVPANALAGELLSDSDPAIVRLGAKLFSDYRFKADEATTAKLVDHLAHANKDVQYAAAVALSRSHPTVLSVQLEMLKGLKSKDPKVRKATLDAIRQLAEITREVKDTRGWATRENVPVSRLVFSPLAQLINDPDASVRDRSVEVLAYFAKQQPQDALFIQQRLEEENAKLTARRLPARAPQLHVENLKKLDSKDWGVRQKAYKYFKDKENKITLSQILKLMQVASEMRVNKQASSMLEQLVERAQIRHPGFHRVVSEMLDSRSSKARILALNLLPKLTDVDSTLTDQAVARMRDRNPEVRKVAVSTVFTMQVYRRREIADALLPLIVDKDADVRKAVGQRLSYASASDFGFVRAAQFNEFVDLYLRTQDPGVKELIYNRFLDTEWPDEARAHDTVIKMLEDPDDKKFGLGARLFVNSSYYAVDEAVTRLLADKYEKAPNARRLEMLKMLVRSRDVTASIQQVLLKPLAGKNPELALQALAVVKQVISRLESGRSGDKVNPRVSLPLAQAVVELTNHADEKIKAKATELVRELAQKQPESAAALAEATRRVHEAQADTELDSDLKAFQELASKEWQTSSKAAARFGENRFYSPNLLVRLLEVVETVSEKDDARFKKLGEIFQRERPGAPEVQAGVVRLLKSDKPLNRMRGIELAKTLPELTKDTRLALGSLLDDPDAAVLVKFLNAATELGIKKDHALTLRLIEFLNSSNEEVRQVAERIFQSSDANSMAHLEQMISVYRQASSQEVLSNLRSKIASDWSRDLPVNERVAALLDESDPKMIELGARVLSGYRFKVTPAVARKIFGLLEHSDEAVRLASLKALKNQSVLLEHEQLPFARALGEKSPALRIAALEALSEVTQQSSSRTMIGRGSSTRVFVDPRILPILVEALSDPDGDIRKKTVSILEKIGTTELEYQGQIDALIATKRARMAAGDDSVDIKRFLRPKQTVYMGPLDALQAKEIFALGPEAIEKNIHLLIPLVVDEDRGIRAKVLEHLASRPLSVGEEQAIARAVATKPKLFEESLPIFEEQPPRSQETLLEYIKVLQSPEVSSAWKLRELLEQGRYEGPALRALVEAAEKGSSIAARMLRELPIRGVEAQKALIDALTSQNTDIVRSAADNLKRSDPDPKLLGDYFRERQARIGDSWTRESVGRVLDPPIDVAPGDWKKLLGMAKQGNSDAVGMLVDMSQQGRITDPSYDKELISLMATLDEDHVHHAYSLIASRSLTPENQQALENIYFSSQAPSSRRAYITWALCGVESSAKKICADAEKNLDKLGAMELASSMHLMTTHNPERVPEVHRAMAKLLHGEVSRDEWLVAAAWLAHAQVEDSEAIEHIRLAAQSHPDEEIRQKCAEKMASMARKE